LGYDGPNIESIAQASMCFSKLDRGIKLNQNRTNFHSYSSSSISSINKS
jgi:hypothetical protein